MAFAFPVFNMERFDKVNPTLSDSSLSDIFRFAIITSKFTMMGIVIPLNRFRFEYPLLF